MYRRGWNCHNQRFFLRHSTDRSREGRGFLHGVGYVFDSLDLVVGKSDPIIKEDVIINTKETDDTTQF